MAVEISHLRSSHTGLIAKIHWHLNEFFTTRLALLDFASSKLTVLDLFGSPGDTLLAATACRQIKERFPRIRLNLLTPNPDLVQLDPCLDSINEKESLFCVWFCYLGLIEHKDGSTNVLKPVLSKLGLPDYEYRSRVYLSKEEVAIATKRLAPFPRPLITINLMSREKVKVWPLENWALLLPSLKALGTVIQLGDSSEPELDGVVRMAGQLSMRESMAVLSQAHLHIGPDSFLMHAANGLDVPSVVIFGGSRTPNNMGYEANENIFTPMKCGPCWIHDSRGEHCEHGVECMKQISPATVQKAVEKLWRGPCH